MKHLGDITQIKGGDIPPVDIITFGSPCQGLSMAGRRRGLADQRSGLFKDAVRIIYEMKEATYDKYPRFILWENVPGALSSAGGCDYQAVLEALTKSKIPMPGSGRWANAGMVRSRGTDLAWCVYNAQYFGTAQRRRRVFLVADFGGKCAGQILFIPKSLQRYFAARRKPGKGTSAIDKSVAKDTGGGDRENGNIGRDSLQSGAESYCIAGNIINRLPQNGGNGRGWKKEMSYTLTAMDRHAVIYVNNRPVTSEEFKEIKEIGINGCFSGPLVASYYKGTGARGGRERDVVLCAASGQSHTEILQNLSSTLHCGCEHPYITYPEIREENGGIQTSYVVRRLTPMEGERLQGFPDHWTEYGFDGELISDSKRYQMLGNSIAVPCVAYIMQGIKEALRG